MQEINRVFCLRRFPPYFLDCSYEVLYLHYKPAVINVLIRLYITMIENLKRSLPSYRRNQINTHYRLVIQMKRRVNFFRK